MTQLCTDINTRNLRLALVDGSQINACVNIDRQPGYDRVSDLISSSREPFLILMNATMHKSGIGTPMQHDTIFVNKDHIVWAIPEENSE